MAPALEAIGRRIEDVRWILLTHGHIDHIGGAHALWELTGRRAQVVVHEADAPMLRSRRAHVEEYLAGRGRYLDDPGERRRRRPPPGPSSPARWNPPCWSGAVRPSPRRRRQRLGARGTGPHPGSVAYAVDGQRSVFTGDAVQVHGAANGFPGYTDPAAYRASLAYLRDEIRPRRLYLGHPYRRADGTPYGVELDEAEARRPSPRAWTSRPGSPRQPADAWRRDRGRRIRRTPRSPAWPGNSATPAIPPSNRRRSSPRWPATARTSNRTCSTGVSSS
ncbi:hypothetical protein SHKM778_50990 [Streptomyces sp. KM77-8]|uniref:Metallo-beta-lactamase domain-containing protein n=1 Tax=Streptomyces haneummycinicus TaxID=3074435 RepID=A0AAT9HMZ1_9ACTN